MSVRVTDLRASFLHKVDNVAKAYKSAVDSGKISRNDADWADDLARRFVNGYDPSSEEMQKLATISRAMSSAPPPVASVVMGNNKGFVAPDLHREYVNDTQRKISPRQWLLRLIGEQEQGVSAARSNRHRDIMPLLRAYFGDDYKDVISASVQTVRTREVTSVEVPRPDFTEIFHQPLARLSDDKPIFLRGAAPNLKPRKPEEMLTTIFGLSRAEFDHFIHKRTNPHIVETLRKIYSSDTAKNLARKLLDIGAYRPTRINTSYIWHLKGIFFEILMEKRQLELLKIAHEQFRHEKGIIVLIRGAKARQFDGDKPLPAKDFSDGLIARIEPRHFAMPKLHTLQIHEMKSGISGDFTSLIQVEKWTARLPDIGQLVIPPSALVTRLRNGRPKTSDLGEVLRSMGEIRARRKIRDKLIDSEKNLPHEQRAWVFNTRSAPAKNRAQRKRRAEVELEKASDPIFLANSEYKMPHIDDDLRGLFGDVVIEPEVAVNLVAEELEYLAIKTLELVGIELFGRKTTRSRSQYIELTKQQLDTLD